MRKFVAIAFSLAFVFAFAGSASASEAMKAADADGSGTISQEEAAAVPGLPEKFGEVDANSDGQIDEAEFAEFEAATEG